MFGTPISSERTLRSMSVGMVNEVKRVFSWFQFKVFKILFDVRLGFILLFLSTFSTSRLWNRRSSRESGSVALKRSVSAHSHLLAAVSTKTNDKRGVTSKCYLARPRWTSE